MQRAATLIDLLEPAAMLRPGHVAVEEPTAGAVTYAELWSLSDRFAARLREAGVRIGDRVGLCLPKSIDAVAAILGVLKTGAAYVPIDPAAPAARSALVLHDCSVRALVVAEELASPLLHELQQLGAVPILFRLPGIGGGRGLAAMAGDSPATGPRAPDRRVGPDDLAYILYTSGSTGRPKGVMLSHRNAVSFVDWCSEVVEPTPEDRFSSHAPLHFDLSILDLYLPLKHGATLVLIDADTGKAPVALADLIAARRISVWYSTPSALSLLAQYGKLERHHYPALRTVLFAGEVFPVKHLRALQRIWPAPRYFNLYGPTETNVCTWFEVPVPVPDDRTEPYPIGRACSHLRTRVIDLDGEEVPAGSEGELLVAGPGVMLGYWNQPEQTAARFVTDAEGARWYRTGDIVVEAPGGDYAFVGRRDRMVKRRGYRIELGEIEAGLYRHPAVLEAAAIALTDPDGSPRIVACLSFREGHPSPSTVELKRFCAGVLPIYMVPDVFRTLDMLPKTSTDKIDYQRLHAVA